MTSEQSLKRQDLGAVFGDEGHADFLFALSRRTLNPPEPFYVTELEGELGQGHTPIARRMREVKDAGMIERIDTPTYDRRELYVRTNHPLWEVVELAESLSIEG
jgi:hypothetical protein